MILAWLNYYIRGCKIMVLSFLLHLLSSAKFWRESQSPWPASKYYFQTSFFYYVLLLFILIPRSSGLLDYLTFLCLFHHWWNVDSSIYVIGNVLISCDCYNNLPLTWWLKIENFSQFSRPEVWSQDVRRTAFALKALGRILPSFSHLLVALGVRWLVAA